MNNPNQYAPQIGQQQQQQPLATAATYQAEMMEMSTTYNTTDSQPLYSHYTTNTTNNNNNNSTLLSQSLMAAQQMMMSAPSIADEQQPTQQYPNQQQQPHYTMPTTTAPTSAVSSLSGGGVSPSYNNNSSMVVAAAQVATASTTTKRIPLPSSTSQSMPTSIFLLKNPLLGLGSNNSSDDAEDDIPPTHPVPEFLCHLYTMVNDKSLDYLISWEVPTKDQSKYEGGGMKGVGKVVVHDPMALQDILGRYYRHSSYPSFQRQLNYFGFKKRLTTKKKGKMSPCSFVHESLGKRPSSMLKLKRRQATKKERKTGSATIVSASTSGGTSSAAMSTNKLSRKKRSKPLIMFPPRPRTIPAPVPLNDCAFNTDSLVNLPEATNDTIIEARKMLEQNFLKEFSVVKEHVPLLQPQDQQLYQQQMAAVLPFQEQPQATAAQQQQLHQQQNEQMLTLLSNHSSAVAMSDNGQLLNHSFTQNNQSTPLWLPTNTLYNPSITANVPQVQGNFQTQATAHTLSTNYLMGEVNTTANNMPANCNPVTTTAANTTVESNTPQGGGAINPNLQQELDTLLNNLLSTALPRANELFNDDTLSDDVSCDLIDEPLQQQEPLQVSDDGGTLSTS